MEYKFFLAMRPLLLVLQPESTLGPQKVGGTLLLAISTLGPILRLRNLKNIFIS
jgi:hypothetical protein